MQSDGYFVTRQPQPLHSWSWPAAAKCFVQTKREFLKEDSNHNIIGKWSACCFPFKGLTNKPLNSFALDEVRKIRALLIQARMLVGGTEFATINVVEKFFQATMEYPPYGLHDNWDGKAMQRRKWAELLFQKKFLVIS